MGRRPLDVDRELLKGLFLEDRSYGSVAREYTRRTGLKISSDTAGQILQECMAVPPRKQKDYYVKIRKPGRKYESGSVPISSPAPS